MTTRSHALAASSSSCVITSTQAPPFRKPAQQPAHLLHVVAVKSARRLVEHHELLAGEHGRRDGHALLLPAREAHRVAVRQLGQPQCRQHLVALVGVSRP